MPFYRTLISIGVLFGVAILLLRVSAWNPSAMSWTVMWGVLLGIVALPAVVSILADRNGKVAAGWLMVFGIFASGVLACIYVVTLLLFFLVGLFI